MSFVVFRQQQHVHVVLPLEAFSDFERHNGRCLVVEVKNIHAILGVESLEFGDLV